MSNIRNAWTLVAFKLGSVQPARFFFIPRFQLTVFYLSHVQQLHYVAKGMSVSCITQPKECPTNALSNLCILQAIMYVTKEKQPVCLICSLFSDMIILPYPCLNHVVFNLNTVQSDESLTNRVFSLSSLRLV